MSDSLLALDKTFHSPMDDGLGKIGIRVVVFKKGDQNGAAEVDEPLDVTDEEDFSGSESEVSGFLERPTRGKLCCVFVINGQRHHGLDNGFIVNELRMKYLRKRMILVVDLDGLSTRAVSEVMQGSRTGLYEGKVYHRIYERLISTLKSDPELIELEDEAEEELSQLQVGDAAVQEALDQLISDHFDAGDHETEGSGGLAGKLGRAITSEGKKIQLDVVKPAAEGESAAFPILLSSHGAAVYRLRPCVKGRFLIGVEPQEEWAKLAEILVVAEPTIPGFNAQLTKKHDHAVVDLEFLESPGFEQDEYPLEVALSVLATFEGRSEIRLTDKLVSIRPLKKTPPRDPPVLLDDPTFIKVSSRQPVRVIDGKGAAHVRMQWDGKDELVDDSSTSWIFDGKCTSHTNVAAITFTRPVSGRFEALLHVAEGSLIGTRLKFEIKASGPTGKMLQVSLEAEIVQLPEALDPRKLKAEIPAQGQRRPPYQVLLVGEKDFSLSTRWGESTWDSTHVGAFIDPKSDAPLTLCINQDFGLLKDYLESLVAKKADETRTGERKTKYISHVAYHLYQMYLYKDKVLKANAQNAEDPPKAPNDDDMQEEINRVGSTLIKLMGVSR